MLLIGMSPSNAAPAGAASRSMFYDIQAQAELVAELGFASLSIGDHHLARGPSLQVLPLMSRLSAYTGEMRLIPLVLLPFYQPILLAEQLATLDVMSAGRTTLIACLGNQPHVHQAFQIPLATRVSRFVETFEIVRSLCAEECVSYHGRHFSFDKVSINPRPLCASLPMWIGGSSDPAIRRAARMGDGWVIGPTWTPGQIEEKLSVYRSALSEYDRTNLPHDVVLRRDVHLAATPALAREEAQPLPDAGSRSNNSLELQESLIIGSPRECIQYVEKMRALGVTQVLFRAAMPHQRLALQTIRLIGAEVIPHFSGNS